VKRVFFRRPSPSMVVAVIAVFLSVAGSAAAAKVITGKSIKNNTITSSDIKNNSIKSGDVKNGSLVKKDFKKSQLPVGPQGPAGRNGTNGFGLVAYRVGPGADVDPNSQGQDEAICPAGTVVVGGGAVSFSAVAGEQAINSSYPSDGGGNGDPGTRAWIVYGDNNSGDPQVLQAYAVCANASSVSNQLPPPVVPKRKR
jgi:hypothetical protein